jgi:hypothetical protein
MLRGYTYIILRREIEEGDRGSTTVRMLQGARLLKRVSMKEALTQL